MELGWWKRDDEGRKFQVHLNLFGGKLAWTWQRARHEPWGPYEKPTDEDWATALELAQNRYQRRLITAYALELVRRRGQRG
jgi:hypothetical protein